MKFEIFEQRFLKRESLFRKDRLAMIQIQDLFKNQFSNFVQPFSKVAERVVADLSLGAKIARRNSNLIDNGGMTEMVAISRTECDTHLLENRY